MNDKTYELIKSRGACGESLKFSEQFDSMKEAIRACERPDWIIWYIKFEFDPDKKLYYKYVIDFAKTVMPFEKSLKSICKNLIGAAQKYIAAPNPENKAIVEKLLDEWDRSTGIKKAVILAEQDEETKKVWKKMCANLRNKYKI